MIGGLLVLGCAVLFFAGSCFSTTTGRAVSREATENNG